MDSYFRVWVALLPVIIIRDQKLPLTSLDSGQAVTFVQLYQTGGARWQLLYRGYSIRKRQLAKQQVVVCLFLLVYRSGILASISID